MAKHLISGDKALQGIKPGDPRRRISDGAGLYLLLFVKGGAHGWRFDYTFQGRRKTLSLGTYPDTGLALARDKAEAARKLVAAGADPSDVRKSDKAAQALRHQAEKLAKDGKALPGSFEFVAREWLAEVHRAKVSAGHADRTQIRFEQDAFPWIGSRPIAEIEAPELLEPLRRVTARGAIETAHRLKDACGQVFRYGIATGVCKRNPAADLRDALPPVVTRHLGAAVKPTEAALLLRAMVDYAGRPVTRAALALSALLFLRPGNVRQMEWEWIDFDASELRVPAEAVKRDRQGKASGLPHIVPLAAQALQILRDLQPLTGGGRFVFPALHTTQRPMSENTVNMALRRMGFDRETATAHGFRAMARTLAAEQLGVDAAVIEAQLAHAVPDALGRAYNRTTWMAQRRDLMVRWADYLDKLRKGGEVVRMPGRAA